MDIMSICLCTAFRIIIFLGYDEHAYNENSLNANTFPLPTSKLIGYSEKTL